MARCGQARLARRATAAAALLLAAVLVGPVPTAAAADPGTLPLGDPDLVETRTSRSLAPGVTLTRIVRGTDPAPPDEINTTRRGPWVVSVLAVDPRAARGHLRATYGPDLARVERTTELVRRAGALAGVNGSFFTFTANPQYPGDPVGLGLFDGQLLSEPTPDRAEVDLVVDAHANRLLIGPLTWSGSLRQGPTGASLALEFVNHPPVVPAGCATRPDPTGCAAPGDVVLFTPQFAAATPSGAGVEVVLDQSGCVLSAAPVRGTALAAGQTAVQATGREAGALLDLAGQGCLQRELTVTDGAGDRVGLHPGVFGVNGRYRLTRAGEIVVPPGTGSFFDRNPRTIAGTTAAGTILLATVDGRRTTSVGTTMQETAAVAAALGMHDAVNLDGGGSTAMAVDGALVNQPSGTTERAVGDALVYLDTPYRSPRP